MSLSYIGRCVRFNRILDTPKIYYVGVVGRRYKTNEVVVNDRSDVLHELVEPPKCFDIELNVTPRKQNRKPKIQPLVKNLCLSKIDPEVLAYPEILEKDDILALDDRLDKIDNVIGDLGVSDESVLEVFKNERILNAPITVHRGGLESNCTERMRFLEEISRLRASVAKQLNSQWSCLDVLQPSLSKESFDTLSSQIVDSNRTLKILFRERISDEVDKPDLQTLSIMSPSGQWMINGEKLLDPTMVVNPNEEFLIVLSSVQYNVFQGFLVHPNASGVTYTDSSVQFKDTPAMILGESVVEKVLDILKQDEPKLLPLLPINIGLAHMRLGEAAITLGLLKESLACVLEQVKGKYFNNTNYAELPLFEDIIADATTVIYKAESMIYLTTGLEDGYEEPDTEVESALCRIYITREATRVMDRFLQNLVPFGLEGNIEELLIEAKNVMKKEQNDWLSVYCSSVGLAYSAFHMKDTVMKSRNPAFHPGHTIKRIFNERRQIKDNPPMNLQLESYLHQSLMEAARNVEYSIMRINYAVECMFIHYGADLLNQHKDLKKLSDILVETYAMIASLSRGSRAYCIGVRNSNKEILQCMHLSMMGKLFIQKTVIDIAEGKFLNGDDCINNIGKHSIKQGKSFAEHPLTRVFF